MKTFTSSQALRDHLGSVIAAGQTIGFVPTMGALHRGHLSLVKQSQKDNDVTVVSIFVNPKQFNDQKDFQRYPQTLESDRHLLEESGCDVLFSPDYEEVYRDETNIPVDLNGLDLPLEGLHRPGHFDGVVQVVARLFDIVTPHSAYFGEKDYQQLLIVKRMVAALGLPIEIKSCPIVRTENGLALSSRNERLSSEEQQTATQLFRELSMAKTALLGNESPRKIVQQAAGNLSQIENIRLEYFEIADTDTLEPIETLTAGQRARALVAAYVGQVRLIDNLSLIP